MHTVPHEPSERPWWRWLATRELPVELVTAFVLFTTTAALGYLAGRRDRCS